MEALRRMGGAGMGGKGLHDGITCGPHGIRYNTYGSHSITYCVAENFQEKTFANWWKILFRGENFRGCSLVPPMNAMHAPKINLHE